MRAWAPPLTWCWSTVRIDGTCVLGLWCLVSCNAKGRRCSCCTLLPASPCHACKPFCSSTPAACKPWLTAVHPVRLPRPLRACRHAAGGRHDSCVRPGRPHRHNRARAAHAAAAPSELGVCCTAASLWLPSAASSLSLPAGIRLTQHVPPTMVLPSFRRSA